MARDRDARIAVRGIGRHLLVPVLPVAILDDERDRGAEGLPPTNARTDLDLVLLDFHPTAAAVALLAPPEVGVDQQRARALLRQRDRQVGRRRALAFAGPRARDHDVLQLVLLGVHERHVGAQRAGGLGDDQLAGWHPAEAVTLRLWPQGDQLDALLQIVALLSV